MALPLAIYLVNFAWNAVSRRGAMARVVKAEVSQLRQCRWLDGAGLERTVGGGTQRLLCQQHKLLLLDLSTLLGRPAPIQTQIHDGPSSKVVVLHMQRPISYRYR